MGVKDTTERVWRQSAFELKFPNGAISYDTIPSPEIKKHSDQLLKLKDLRKKLQYYNDNICSLSYYSDHYCNLHSCGEYAFENGVGEIFFSLKNPYTDSENKIYYEERQKEIDRIIKLLHKHKESYKERLNILFNKRLGQKRPNELKIFSNPPDLKTEIFLEPMGPEENECYNTWLMEYVRMAKDDPGKLHWTVKPEYPGFRFEVAYEKKRKEFEAVSNKDEAIKYQVDLIQSIYKIGQVIDYSSILHNAWNGDLDYWMAALFHALLNGHLFDYSRYQLSLDKAERIIHVEEVHKYYNALLELKSTRANKKLNGNHQSIQPDGKSDQRLTISKIAENENVINQLLIKMDLINSDGHCFVTGKAGNQGGTKLSATASAIKDHKTNLLKNTYALKEIVDAFCNQYNVSVQYTNKGKNFKKFKDNATGFIGAILKLKK